jgi:hypothetical protein
MFELLAELVPLMLAAAANPAVVTIVVIILSAADRPVGRASAFVAGFGLVLVGVGIAGLLIFGGARETFGRGGPAFAWLDIVLGAGLLVFAVITFVRRDRASTGFRLVERLPPPAFLGVGALFMATNTSALVAYAPLLRDIADSGLGAGERALALAISDLVIIAPIAAPVAIRIAAPQSSQRALDAIRRFLDRWGYAIVIAVFGALGAYLLIRGIGRV